MADAPPSQPDWPHHSSRPAPLRPTTPTAFAEPSFRPKRGGRWLRPAFPWLPPHALVLLASLALLAGVVAGVAAVMGGSRPPVAAAALAAQQQLRHLVGQLEECRGIESLLVMLPVGTERDATLVRLKRQQVSIDAWLRDNGPQLTARHGPQALMDLRESVRAWHVLQQRVAEAEVVQTRTGLARESRQLLTGPSAEAYRQMISLVDRLSLQQPS